MKIFGYFLAAIIALLAFVLAIPAFNLGKIALGIGIVITAFFLIMWVYAIYGPFNTAYETRKSALLSLLGPPIGLVTTVGFALFFLYRATAAVWTYRCEIDYTRSFRYAYIRDFFNFACSTFGPIGFALAQLPFVIGLACFFWAILKLRKA